MNTAAALQRFETPGFAGGADDALPTAILRIGRNDIITSANALASALFAPINPVGLGLRTLFGLCGASGGLDLMERLAAGESETATRLHLTDGRVLDCRTGTLASGPSRAIVLLDVTAYVREAELAAQDSLTGLAKRRSFHDATRDALARSLGAGTETAILYLDLDRFKAVNDTLGHPFGDALLTKVAERLRNAVPADEIVARLGGDEFAILQTGVEQPAGAETLARRLVDLVSRTYAINGHMANVGVSIGIAVAPHHGDDPDVLLKRADLALYAAKAQGRGAYRLFETAMDDRMQQRRLMELDLRRALAFKELELVYQPQFHLASDSVAGFEALLRWESPSRGVVLPADFIPLAEEIGAIVQMGEWVLRTACAAAATWPAPVSIAVNLSPVQFRGGKLVETVVSALAASGLEPSRLELEITEGALLDNTDMVLSTLRALRALGVRISMDDFGTGYASLSYLQKFPFDKIKIDQSFIRDLMDNAHCGAIVRAVASLGASIGMTTTAEGVETAQQLERIRREGCTEVQGFLTGKPLPFAAAAALLALSPQAPVKALP